MRFTDYILGVGINREGNKQKKKGERGEQAKKKEKRENLHIYVHEAFF